MSVLHDLTGYRPENVFALNTVLTFGLLGLAYLTGRNIGGRGAGAVAVLLLTSLPLLAQNATGEVRIIKFGADPEHLIAGDALSAPA